MAAGTNRHLVFLLMSLVILVCSPGVVHGAEGEKSGESTTWTEVLENGEEVSNRRVAQILENLPEGHKLRVTFHKVWGMSKKKLLTMLKVATPLDEKSRPHGLQQHFRPWRGVYRTVNYEKGQKHGLEKVFEKGYEKGTPKSVIEWARGERLSRKVFHPNGELGTIVKYENGEPIGESRSFGPEGRLTRVVRYEAGKRHGEMVTFWPETGEKKRVVPLEKGLVTGVVREYYKDGSKKAEMPFRRDSLHGVQKQWDEDGNLERRRYWLDGELVPRGVFDEKFEEK